MARLWPTLDWARLDATFPAFAVLVAQLVQKNRGTSAGLSAAYLRAFRSTAGIPGEAKAVFAQPLNVDQFTTSLRSTSVVALKESAKRGVPAEKALPDALTQAQGAMSRLVLNAGRETTIETLRADTAAVGWQRILGTGGCNFCRVLAERGAVYKEETVDFAAHDHCGCSVVPQYGGELRTVKEYVPSTRFGTPGKRAANNAGIRTWLQQHPSA